MIYGAVIIALAGLVFWASRRDTGEERLEMHRDATEAERLATGVSDEESH